MAIRPSGGTGRAWAPAAIALCAAVLTALLVPASSEAKFKVGLHDFDYVTSDAQLREEVFDKTVKENASVARINLSWFDIGRRVPADATNPADPAYDFSLVDAAVEAAAQRGLEPLLLMYRAPGYAEGPGRPDFDTAPIGGWKPNPAAVADFARAVATRYSGHFGGLPRVRNYQIWNEPNLKVWLTPQRDGNQITSAFVYRRMLNAAYSAIKGVDRRNRVITAGVAPYGDDSGPERVRPLAFLRALLCLRPDLRGRTCNEEAHFDVIADQPINTTGGPADGATHPDDVAGSDFKNVVKTLRAAERLGTAPGRRHAAWVTEMWWETNPPDYQLGLPLKTQARYIQQAFYVYWKQGADVVINFQVHDALDPTNPLANVQTGVFFNDFKPKPSATAFAFPFVTDRRSKNKLLAWGIAPKKGKLRIQRKDGKRWRTVDRLRAKRGKIFKAKIRVRGKAKLRAKVKREKSLVWKQEGGNGRQRAGAHQGGGGSQARQHAAPRLLRPSPD